MATTADDRVHAYDIARERMRVIYDGLASRSAPLLRVDQLTANRAGEVFVCEDISTEEIDIGVIDRSRRVSRFLSATGPQHENSELTGVTFDPSGAGCTSPRSARAGPTGWPGPARFMRFPGLFMAGGVHALFTRRIRALNRQAGPPSLRAAGVEHRDRREAL